MSSSVGVHVVPASTFCVICSGFVAPAMTLDSPGCASSHANVACSIVTPRSSQNRW